MLSPLRWLILEPPTFNHFRNPLSSIPSTTTTTTTTTTTHHDSNQNNSSSQNNNFSHKINNENVNKSFQIGEKEIVELNVMESNDKLNNDMTLDKSKIDQISEYNTVNGEINESSINDFICLPGDFIVLSGPFEIKNIRDNCSKLALNEQEISGKIGFWKSELCIF